jgi:hypothetical protein
MIGWQREPPPLCGSCEIAYSSSGRLIEQIDENRRKNQFVHRGKNVISIR